MHASAQRTGLAINCNITYLDLPICVGHGEDGMPVVEVKPWPFILPSEMVSWRNQCNVVLFLFSHSSLQSRIPNLMRPKPLSMKGIWISCAT